MPVPGPAAARRGASWCPPAPPFPMRGATRPSSRSTTPCSPTRARPSQRLHALWLARQPVVVALGHRPGPVPRAAVVPDRAVAGGARVGAVVRPPPLPDVGQHVRRPGRRSGVVVGGQGGAPRRRGGGHAGRAGRHHAPRRHAGVGRRRAADAGAGRARRRAQRLGRPRLARHRPGGRRAASPTSRPTSSPRSPTSAGRPGSSPRPARARPVCSPSACATSTATAATSRAAVLAVAYNKQAQLEMESRTTDFRPRVRTLNSLGLWVLAEHRGGSPPVVEETEVRRLVDSLLPGRRQRRANTDPHRPVRRGPHVGPPRPHRPRRRRGGARRRARPRRAVPGVPRPPPHARGVVDFDEQIYAAVEVLLADGPFRRSIQRSCRHLLVDEFQDLTPAHVLLVRLLALPCPRRVRRRRRRPVHLRPRRRRPVVPHRLRPAVPRRRRRTR